MCVLYCLHRWHAHSQSVVSAVSQNLRFDGDFLQAIKCAFLQPQQKSVWCILLQFKHRMTNEAMGRREHNGIS